MVLFLLVFALEMKPMITLIQWRMKNRKGESFDVSQARSLAFISHIELGLLSIILLFAIAMARGIWY
jgi:putative membrane protein